jgi:hypothetical protein
VRTASHPAGPRPDEEGQSEPQHQSDRRTHSASDSGRSESETATGSRKGQVRYLSDHFTKRTLL